MDRTAREHGERVFLPRRDGHGGEPVSFARLRRDVRALAGALLTRGLRKGDRVALVAENSYAWLLADLAVTYVGGVDVPRGADTTPSELRHILDHSGCRFAIAENAKVVAELHSLRAELPQLEAIFTMAPAGGVDCPSIFELVAEDDTADVDEAAAEVEPDDLLTIVYTSGTTAEPKGVMLTHQNMARNATFVNEVLGANADDVFLSVLPAWHVYERVIDYLALTCGAQLVYTTRRAIKDDLKNVAPTVFAAVPRVWETIHDGILGHCGKLSGLTGKLMQSVLVTARLVGAGKASPWRRVLHRVYDKTLLAKLRTATGGRLRLAVSGGGALPSHVDELLLGIGLPLLNGYGLTETSPVVCVRPPGDNRVGTIGPPIPHTEVEIRDENGEPLPRGHIGLVWIRGPQVMRGYFRNEETTRRVLTEDGWFNSGDLGCIDPRGHVRITGRAKDTIVLAGGENVEPEPLETGLKSSPLVEQAVVLGQDQKVLGAVLIPRPEELERKVPRSEWGEKDGELTGEKVVKLLRAEVDKAMTRSNGFRPCERIAKFKVRLEPMTVENGLLTPTMKVKRHEVQAQMRNLIDGMFL